MFASLLAHKKIIYMRQQSSVSDKPRFMFVTDTEMVKSLGWHL